MKKYHYAIVGCKSWNRTFFEKIRYEVNGHWHYIEKKEDLTVNKLRKLAPRYIFFLHWSEKVPSDIIEEFECVCFHMADVPYGRGGSPLQNNILRGFTETKLTALRMTDDFDAGPVYLKERFSLLGGAEEIYMRATRLSGEMIKRIIENDIDPTPQEGKGVVFKRRKPSQSRIREHKELEELFDFIRMLDAEGYPKAFFHYKGFKYEINRAALYNKKIIADLKITKA
jgi:methionyl-tRNA formyltransferase